MSTADRLALLRTQGDLTQPPQIPKKSSPVPKGLAASSQDTLAPASELLLPLPDPHAFGGPPASRLFATPIDSPLPPQEEQVVHDSPPRRTAEESRTPDRLIDPHVRATALLRSPHVYHRADLLASPDKKVPGAKVDNATKREVKRAEVRIDKKRKHCLMVDSPYKDLNEIYAGRIKPNEKGLIKVSFPNGEYRLWGIHEKNNADGTNRVFPVRGRNIVPLDGRAVREELDDYRKKKGTTEASPSFSDHLKKRVKVVSSKDSSSETDSPVSVAETPPVVRLPTLSPMLTDLPKPTALPLDSDEEDGPVTGEIPHQEERTTGKRYNREPSHDEEITPLKKRAIVVTTLN